MTGQPDTHNEIKRLALHACCGPCLIEPLDAFEAHGADVTVVFSNSNIQPAEEYELRRQTLLDYAERHGVTVVELEYEPERWQQATRGAETREQRCEACYRLRLESVATWAAANGVDAIATTLTVSPYQDADAIERAGIESARLHGVGYVHEDFTGRYQEATRRSREEAMYRQDYCGCGPSKVEAQAERELRRARRQAKPRAGD